MRFTVDGSQDLEDRISQDMLEIHKEVLNRVGDRDIAGLILGGGYGRGEGGVFIDNGIEQVYNDYDFFVIVPYRSRSRRKKLMKDLAEVKSVMEPRCGIHVDFSPAMPQASLVYLPYELMFMELKAGHHVVIGPDDILAEMPDYDMSHPPLEECTRLFMNRGIGLFLAHQKIKNHKTLNKEDYEFVVRNIRKAQLAMGDALLFLKGCYSPSYLERQQQFRSLDLTDVPEGKKLAEYYEAAMKFKLRPNHEIPAGFTISAWHDEVTQYFEKIFLWFEQHRLNDFDLTWNDYARKTRRFVFPGMLATMKNILKNLRIRTSHLPLLKELSLHPRDRILAHLPELLFDNLNDKGITADVLRLWERSG